MSLRRFVHTTANLQRGRTAFYNIHKKVDDPAKQDPDYFEKKARLLPLDENYIDALSKLYYEKIGSERDLGLKAADNLISEKVTFGLPEINKSKPMARYENLDILENAPESVKKIFSVEMATRRDLSHEWKRALVDAVKRNSLDGSSIEQRIGFLTALIRHWSLLVNDIGQETPKKPTWLTHKIWLVINERRKLLRKLREQDTASFENVVQQLKISYHVPKQPTHAKTRKAWAEAQLRARVEEEKEKRLEELHALYDKNKEDNKKEVAERRKALLNELAEVESKMEAVAVVEGKNIKAVGTYQPSLISNLSETVMHSALFYHPKPTLAQN